jgi:hypothetical protein
VNVGQAVPECPHPGVPNAEITNAAPKIEAAALAGSSLTAAPRPPNTVNGRVPIRFAGPWTLDQPGSLGAGLADMHDDFSRPEIPHA